MAAEVDNQQYYHLEYLDFPEPPVQNSGSVTVTSLLSAVEKGERVDIPLPRHPRIGRKNYIFRYNPLHDLESLWWIAIYFLVNKEITCNNEEEPSSSDPDISWRATIEQRAHAEALFYHNQPRVNVMLAFGRDFEYIISTLSPSLQPIAFILDDVRKLLIGGYQRAERNPETIDHTAADGLHEYFITAFFEIAGDLADQSLVVHPFVDLPSTSMDHE
ncbi:hypothetical protein PHLCEN_2v3172 [Hermanssonia centrifuga]|uniref:Fungal-type protein kinase domain-containing protein n=1 Tax=Hermanssonia centrifuga TaxID=98765 RepID=A0A2R6R101_9APHY|nr:hypothetical protein PHLCEN_2v3172 [Hermanssonia centrifuga]